jgi:hypothetical protein
MELRDGPTRGSISCCIMEPLKKTEGIQSGFAIFLLFSLVQRFCSLPFIFLPVRLVYSLQAVFEILLH